MPKPFNPFSQSVAEYSDKQILTILEAPYDYAPILTEACRVEATQRDLQLPAKSSLNEDKTLFYTFNVKNLIYNGDTYEQCKQYLLSEGLNDLQTENIMKNALELPKKNISQPYKDKDFYGVRIGTGLFVIYIIFRLLTMVAR